MKKPTKPIMNRRDFIKWSGCVSAAAAAFPLLPGEFATADALAKEGFGTGERRTLLSACPYCGVGCGTLIKVENGKVVGMVPDKKHPTNKGIQCIKGLNAHEPIYKDRLTKVLVRKDMSDPLRRATSRPPRDASTTTSSARCPTRRPRNWSPRRSPQIIKESGGNSVGLNGSRPAHDGGPVDREPAHEGRDRLATRSRPTRACA